MKSLSFLSRADALMTEPVQEPSADSTNTADLATFSATDDQSAADSARDENATDRAMRSVRCFMRVILSERSQLIGNGVSRDTNDAFSSVPHEGFRSPSVPDILIV